MPDRFDLIRPPAPGAGSGGSSHSWASHAAGSPASAPRAIDYPPARSAFHRRVAFVLASLLVGLGALVGFAVAVNAVGARSQWLVQHGVKTAGAIVTVGADTRLHSGDAEVIYLVAGRVLRGMQQLGSDAANFHPAERVTVYYDPHHPNDFTIAGEDNQSTWSVWAMVALLCLGLAVLPPALFVAVQTVRIRRILGRLPWRQAGIRYRGAGNYVVVQVAGSPVVPAGGGDQAGIFRTGMLGRSGPAVAERGFAKLALGRTTPDGGAYRDSSATVWVAGPSGRRLVIPRADGRGYLLLKGPRSPERRDKWIRLLTS